MKEEGTDSLEVLRSTLNSGYDENITYDLSSAGLVDLDEQNNTIALTKKGQEHARRIIRAHRLAERLLYDVLGGDFESGACEFEHTLTHELVDSICVLLGHPKSCPHGMPIPEGECCKNSSRTAQSSVVQVVELEVGQSARIAYVNCKSDQQLHKIDSLHIRPGVTLTLHQKYPCYVVECEGSDIALDKEIASNICVWREPAHTQDSVKHVPARTH
jgi:DtxR family Mn-dependent transcriptional regulator